MLTRAVTQYGRVQPSPQPYVQVVPSPTHPPFGGVLDEHMVADDYGILEHLSKVLVRLLVLDLIKSLPKNQKALYSLFNKAWVNVDISPKALENVAALAFGASIIVFANRDLPEPEYRSSPLHLTFNLNGHEVRGTLIDIEASLNVMSAHTLQNIEIPEPSLAQSTMIILAYKQSKKLILGKIII